MRFAAARVRRAAGQSRCPRPVAYSTPSAELRAGRSSQGQHAVAPAEAVIYGGRSGIRNPACAVDDERVLVLPRAEGERRRPDAGRAGGDQRRRLRIPLVEGAREAHLSRFRRHEDKAYGDERGRRRGAAWAEPEEERGGDRERRREQPRQETATPAF